METYASAFGRGAVLMQPDARCITRSIAYASRALNSAESNYLVTHRWALKHFRDIIIGYPMTVYTDHAAVTELFTSKGLTGRLLC